MASGEPGEDDGGMEIEAGSRADSDADADGQGEGASVAWVAGEKKGIRVLELVIVQLLSFQIAPVVHRLIRPWLLSQWSTSTGSPSPETLGSASCSARVSPCAHAPVFSVFTGTVHGCFRSAAGPATLISGESVSA